MFLSEYFLPTAKESPSEAKILSHRYMLRSGMIRQSGSGIYSWLPIGLRVLRKIEKIIRDEQNRAGAQELLMPTIQSADIWKESGRYADYGKEMLRFGDRHGRELLYGPTNEELITEIFRDTIRSYKDLPLILYHIQWKFRDEVRPRFGVMRGREFLMKDSYSFDMSFEEARSTYNKMFVCYLRIFNRMGLKAIPMTAESGPIGGDMSHEFLILADTGESQVFCDRAILDYSVSDSSIDYKSDLQHTVDKWTSLYAATDEKHDKSQENVLGDKLISARGIEVGHIFYFGKKYSQSMNARVSDRDGNMVSVEMGSYGIGVSRLVAAVIEAYHDDNGILWPPALAPFDVGLINLNVGDQASSQMSREVYQKLTNAGVEVLYDDRDERAGVKFADMDLIGLPLQMIVGPRGTKNDEVELKERKTGKIMKMSLDKALKKILEG
ncbi:MAG: Proline--tRNA ligase [Alphaproteobacteria bacterium MarineAlpha3_Bin7]|nr:MAG: Proline--tRNA ligase [Alphaproteobacteria bacterium MarineAlpha3_Bin7]